VLPRIIFYPAIKSTSSSAVTVLTRVKPIQNLNTMSTTTPSNPLPFVPSGPPTNGNSGLPLAVDISVTFDGEALGVGMVPGSSQPPSMSIAASYLNAADDHPMDDELEFAALHDRLSGLYLSDTEMDDGDNDSDPNCVTDSESDSESSEEEEEDDGEDDPQQSLEADENEMMDEETDVQMLLDPVSQSEFMFRHNYHAWIASQGPNISFTVRCKSVQEGRMIATESVRLWYRDFRGQRQSFLQAIIDRYQLLGEHDITGFTVKERRSKTWVDCGADEETWNSLLARIRNPIADDTIRGIADAVRAKLKVLVGGDRNSFVGKIVDRGIYPVMEEEDDPDL
jgi:hypothetical protein